MFTIYPKECYGLKEIDNNSIDAVVTDPPYGIDLEHWDKMPDKQIWSDCFRVLKPGGFLLCFSSIQYQHIFTQDLLDAGFEFKDILLWVYLNGRVPPIDLDKKIDKFLGEERPIVGQYNYVQGTPNSKKKSGYTQKNNKTAASEKSQAWIGFGTGLKTAYEPIIMVQKPLDVSLAHNVIVHNIGALNIDATRIPYDKNESKVGHNPHPSGRVMANILQTENFGDYQKFFFVGKVRDGKKTGNIHPTVKPLELMNCLNTLVTLKGQVILDPFMGSGSTGVSANQLNRKFIGYENIESHFEIAQKKNERIKVKFFTIFLISLLFSASSEAQQLSNTEFLSRYQENVNMMLKKYPQPVEKKLDAQIFDINNQSFYQFLVNSKGKRKYENDLMAMMYFNDLQINKKNSSFCFILYNSKSTLVEDYFKNALFSVDDTILYLSLHEMGHCFAHHQKQLGNIQDNWTPKEEEQIAEMFSMAYFITSNKKSNAVQIIRQNKRVNKSDIHYNPDELEKFFILFNQEELSENINTNMKELFSLTYKQFLNIKNDRQ